MCRKKLLVLFLISISLSLSSVIAKPITTSLWSGIKTTSTYSETLSFGAQVQNESFIFNVEQIGALQTQSTLDLNFKTNKTLRQEVFISSFVQYNEWLNTNISYLIGQDLKLSIFYLKYRIGVQLGFNYIFPINYLQHAFGPTLYLDTGISTSFLRLGFIVGSITETDSTLQTVPLIKPYISIPIHGLALNLSTEFKLSDYLPDKIFPVIALAVRFGFSYTGCKEE